MNNTFRVFKKEIKTISKDKLVIPSIIILLLFTVYGLLDTTSANEMSLTNLNRTSLTISLLCSNVVAIPAATLFAIITCFTLSRDKRKRSEFMMQSIMDYNKLNLIRVMAVIFYAFITVVLITIVSFIVQKGFLNIKFDIFTNMLTYNFIIFSSMIFAILLCSGIYFIIQSMDATFLTFGVCFFTGISSSNYLFNWINYSYSIYSDFAGIQPITKYIIYSRLFQLMRFLCIFVIGILFRNRYEFSLFKSFSINIKSIKVVAVCIVVFIASTLMYIKEPYTDKVDAAVRYMKNDEANERIILKEVYPASAINTKNEIISCDVKYVFKKDYKEEYINFKRNRGLNIKNILVDKKETSFLNIDKDDTITIPVPKGEEVDVTIKYDGTGGHSTANVVTISEYMFNREKSPLKEGKREYNIFAYYHDIEILSHEIAHQWWGGGVNITGNESWITEGLANYSAYRYLDSEFGKEAWLRSVQSWQRGVNNPNKKYFEEKNLQDKIPKETQMKLGLYDKKRNAYMKVPLELIRIEDEGKCDVKKNLADLYKKYKMQSLTYDEFLKEMKIE